MTPPPPRPGPADRKSTRLNSSHVRISYAVFCLKKKKTYNIKPTIIMIKCVAVGYRHVQFALRALHVNLVRCVFDFFFFFNDTATTEIYTLSLHDALPILMKRYRDDQNEASTDVKQRRFAL